MSHDETLRAMELAESLLDKGEVRKALETLYDIDNCDETLIMLGNHTFRAKEVLIFKNGGLEVDKEAARWWIAQKRKVIG